MDFLIKVYVKKNRSNSLCRTVCMYKSIRIFCVNFRSELPIYCQSNLLFCPFTKTWYCIICTLEDKVEAIRNIEVRSHKVKNLWTIQIYAMIFRGESPLRKIIWLSGFWPQSFRHVLTTIFKVQTQVDVFSDVTNFFKKSSYTGRVAGCSQIFKTRNKTSYLYKIVLINTIL